MIQMLKKHNPKQFIEAFPVALQVTAEGMFPTINDARESEGIPTIADVALAYGDNAVTSWIGKQLLAVANFVSARTMTDQQVAELSFQIRFNYEKLNAFEFILFCARMRAGRYKEFYGTIDPMAIMKSLDMFWQERFDEQRAAYQKREKEREEREREEHNKEVMAFRQWYNNLSKEEREKYDAERKRKIQQLLQKS